MEQCAVLPNNKPLQNAACLDPNDSLVQMTNKGLDQILMPLKHIRCKKAYSYVVRSFNNKLSHFCSSCQTLRNSAGATSLLKVAFLACVQSLTKTLHINNGVVDKALW